MNKGQTFVLEWLSYLKSVIYFIRELPLTYAKNEYKNAHTYNYRDNL